MSLIRQLEAMIKGTTDINLKISKDHERILEYFWNSKKNKRRVDIPLSVIYFFESEGFIDELRNLKEGKADALIRELEQKGYVDRSVRKPDHYNFMVRSEEVIKLASHGIDFINERHPKALIWWAKILEAVPNSITLALAILGAVGSAVGIWDSPTVKKLLHLE